MSETELASYFSRMINVPGIGKMGLQKLRSANVAVVGVGGVGSSVSYYLAQSGIGHLRLIDQDIVEPSNLHRLHGVNKSDLYHPKAEAMAESLMRLMPSSEFEPVVDTIRSSNATELLDGSDVVVDGLDNFRTRFVLNRHSVRTGTPYVFSSAIQNQGHIGVFRPPETACLECRFARVTDSPQDSCEVLGVTPIITGAVGALAASETLKLVLSSPECRSAFLLTVDAATSEFIPTEITKRKDCKTCGETQDSEKERAPEPVATLCGGRTFNVVQSLQSEVDLASALESIPRVNILSSTSRALAYRSGNVTISLFRNGRVLVDGVENRDEALRIAAEAVSLATKRTAIASLR